MKNLYFSIQNLTKSKIDDNFFTDITKEVFKKLNFKKPIKLDLIICDTKTIRRLNKIYRKKNQTTDVLAFGLRYSEVVPRIYDLIESEIDRKDLQSLREEFISPPDNILHLGDIVICYQKAKDQAGIYGHSIKKELAYLLTHGILHLTGYDHEKEKDREKMEKIEEEIIRSVLNSKHQASNNK